MKKRFSFTLVVMCFALVLSGCFLLNPIPEEYINGVRVPREFPDDELEIYDDATVFEVDERKDEISLTYGTEDDIDDVIDFYEDLFDDSDELTVEETDDGRGEYYAKGQGKGFEFEIEAEEARGEIEEKLFATVVIVKIEFLKIIQPPVTETVTETNTTTPPANEATATPRAETSDPQSEYDPTWADDYSPYYIDVTNLSDADFEYYVAETIWHNIGYYDGNELEQGSAGTIIYYDDGTFEDAIGNDIITGTWYISSNVMYCTYDNGNYGSWEIAIEFAGTQIYFYYYDSANPGSFWIYSTLPPGTIMMYYIDDEMASLISDRTFHGMYYMYADGSVESIAPTFITTYRDGTFEEQFEGWMYTGVWSIVDGYFEFGYDNSESLYSRIEVDYDTSSDICYIFFADDNDGREGNYWVYVSWY